MASGTVAVDVSSHPFVHIRFAASPMDDEDVDRMLADFTALLERRERFVALLDCRDMRMPANPKQRKRLADWQTQPETYEGTRTHLRASAVLVRSAVVRGAATAVMWLFPPPAPTKLFGTPGDAIEWLRTRCEEEGIGLPARATDHLDEMVRAG